MNRYGIFSHYGDNSPSPVELKHVHYDLRISNFILEKTIILSFENAHECPIEMEYRFFKDPKCAIVSLEVEFFDPKTKERQNLEGRIVKVQEGREEFDDIISEGNTPVLVERKKDWRGGYVSVNLGNVGIGIQVKVKMKSVSEVEYVYWCSEKRCFVMRVLVPAASRDLNVVKNVSFECCVMEEVKEMTCLNYDDGLFDFETGTLKTKDKTLLCIEKDIKIEISFLRKTAISGEIEKVGEGQYYACVTLLPNSEREESIALSLDITFVVDCSASMTGIRRIGLVKQFLEDLTREFFLNLRKSKKVDIRLNLVRFGSDFEELYTESVELENCFDTVLKFIGCLEADLGGTNLVKPLEYILKKEIRRDVDARYIVLISDGKESNESDILNLLKKKCERTKIFSVGVGESDSKLLEMIDLLSYSRTFYLVMDTHRNEEIAKVFVEQLLQPVITNVDISFKCEGRDDVSVSSSSVLFNRSRRMEYYYLEYDSLECKFQINGGATSVCGMIRLSKAPSSKIGALVSWKEIIGIESKRQIDEKDRKKILELGLKYHILTSQTSFIFSKENKERIQEVPAFISNCKSSRKGRRGINRRKRRKRVERGHYPVMSLLYSNNTTHHSQSVNFLYKNNDRDKDLCSGILTYRIKKWEINFARLSRDKIMRFFREEKSSVCLCYFDLSKADVVILDIRNFKLFLNDSSRNEFSIYSSESQKWISNIVGTEMSEEYLKLLDLQKDYQLPKQSTKTVSDWNVDDVMIWLKGIFFNNVASAFDRYGESFRKNNIDGHILVAFFLKQKQFLDKILEGLETKNKSHKIILANEILKLEELL